MKITVFSARSGKVDITGNDVAARERFVEAFTNDLIGNIDGAVSDVMVSPARIRSLVARIQTAAARETSSIVPTAVRIFQRAKSGSEGGEVLAFSSDDIRRSGATAGAGEFGSVRWLNLTKKWQDQKARRDPRDSRRFFTHTGSLRSYLQNNADVFARRLGVAQVTSKIRLPKRGTQRRELRRVLGQIQVKIFPRLSLALAPMLTSNRWTTAGNGEFERAMFGDLAAQKLSGPSGRHRPLFLPLVQYWAAFRMPRAVADAVNSWANSSRGGK